MKISDMHAFNTLAKHLNFTRAANELFITQPTLSKYILRIEDELSVTLFVRTKHGVELTEIGQIVHETFKDIVERYSILQGKIVPHTINNGELKIGMLYYAINEYISPVLKASRRKFPDANFLLFSYQPNPLIKDLFDDKIDVGVVFNVDFDGSNDLIFHRFCKEKLVLAVSRNHRFANRESVSVKEIGNDNIVLIDDVQKTFQSRFFIKNNVSLENVIMAEHIDTLEYTVHESNGIAVVASHIRNMIRNDIILVDIIEEQHSYIDMMLAYKKTNNNPMISLFCKQIDHVFKNIPYRWVQNNE